ETWSDARDDESLLRPCIEDFLCAGLILGGLDGEPDAEAIVAVGAYRACAGWRDELIRNSPSGRELIERGYAADVTASLADDTCPCVAKLERDHFVAVRTDPGGA
ncbi:MAG TPA: 2-phosphosulfolactate phosphatase, partial [Polyangiaceae bacterium]